MKNPTLKMTLALIPILFIPLSELFRAWLPEAYIRLFSEDGLIEYSQAALYLVSGIIAGTIGIDFLKRNYILSALVYFIFSIFLLFVCMEEISWGTRIFGLELPEYFQRHNLQGEISIHHLDFLVEGLHNPNLEPSWGGYLYFFLGLGFFLYMTFAWLVIPKRLVSLLGNRLHYFVPSWYLTPFFLHTFGCCVKPAELLVDRQFGKPKKRQSFLSL